MRRTRIEYRKSCIALMVFITSVCFMDSTPNTIPAVLAVVSIIYFGICCRRLERRGFFDDRKQNVNR